MKTLSTTIACFAIAVISANVTFAEHVKTDYDRAADFSRYRTYSWEKVQTRDPLWVSRIKQAVDAVFAAKGWTLTETGGDIAVVALEMTKEHQTLNTFYDNFGGRWRWGGGFGDATTITDNYTVGTLVVDLFDSKTKQLVWRGSASDTLSDKSGKNIKALDKGVQKMFEHFPPGINK